MARFVNSTSRVTLHSSRNALHAFTLIELIITIALFVMITGITTYIFRAVILSWSSSEKRSGVDIILDRALEEISRDLRDVEAMSFINNDEIRFGQDSTDFCVYYFYNQNDTYPSLFNQSLYQLRRANLTGGISGSFTYGSGKIIATDILPPPTSDLSITSNIATIDLSAKVKDDTVRKRTRIKPRNL